MKKVIAVLLAFTLALSISITAVAADSGTSSGNGLLSEVGDDAAVDASIFNDNEAVPTSASDIVINAPSAILIEEQTGQVLYEKNADEKLEPASVTKVMTILLIVEAIESGEISLDDMVTVSDTAASMGGSQIFLEAGEQMSVRDMLKSIIVSSANDAAVAMAEKVSGSESVFVAKMNERAQELGMTNTHFTNCTGLKDDTAHVTTARDIAIMSRELIQHDWIKQFTTIWMDTVRDGEFGLSNTNKLIRYYNGATGLKTGFTSEAMYCLSATAERDGVEYIAVIMHGATSAERFADAQTLLNFAFANYTLIPAAPDEAMKPVGVTLGKTPYVQLVINGGAYLLIEKKYAQTLSKKLSVADTVAAPINAGDPLGEFTISNGDTVLGTYPVVAGDSVGKLGWGDIFTNFLKLMFVGKM